ncbi:MAG: D-2-hydroxyacid dehydrogenase [Hominisplanchenecus sp.]|nr:D-2-hydroxyacid dehydrogenase [Hominisplanchenecus sp.]
MEIVFLETISLGDDIDLSRFDELGHVTKYTDTPIELVPERVKDADVVVVNKIPMNEKTLSGAGHLKLVAVTATGMDNIDRAYTDSRGIASANVAGYSTEAVAQHTFALMFYIVHKLAYYDQYVKSGQYCTSVQFSHFEEKFFELTGKTWGIVGMGAIGRRVAEHAKEFGCQVIYCSTSGKNTDQPYEQVDFEEILKRSDILSVHAPLTPATRELFNRDAFAAMKSSAVFINAARGAIVDEEALAWALENDEIAGAALDVLAKEPMRKDNPLLRIQDSRKLIITPHIAWAPKETRERLMDGVYENIRAYV